MFMEYPVIRSVFLRCILRGAHNLFDKMFHKIPVGSGHTKSCVQFVVGTELLHSLNNLIQV
ncbi:hypothetical protein M6B38_321225 [Iris pallida]|uniref:Uncharacterized protein n=1 Tax=Iris pallida TaxID=29817 RepID=A0AAX6HC36_IRIPA|nr:hypothetical protein M6B38_321225 [Iris pallida]